MQIMPTRLSCPNCRLKLPMSGNNYSTICSRVSIEQEIDVNELREENLDNYKNNIDTETPVFYVDNVPFKSANLRKQLFEPHKHKTKINNHLPLQVVSNIAKANAPSHMVLCR